MKTALVLKTQIKALSQRLEALMAGKVRPINGRNGLTATGKDYKTLKDELKVCNADI